MGKREKTSPESQLCLHQLRERGWTPALVRTFLGPPDATKKNPHYAPAAPMKLYDLRRVKAAERRAKWKQQRSAAAKRSQASLEVAARKRECTIQEADRIKIRVKAHTPQSLLKEAIDHYNERSAERAIKRGTDDDRFACESDSPAFLQRIQVNYARHQLSNYERLLRQWDGRTGVAQAVCIACRRVFEQIARRFPWLADECTRQLRRAEEMLEWTSYR